MKCTMKRAAELFCLHNNIILLSHARPDGDTLGSTFGLKYALEAVGKKVEIVTPDGLPPRLSFIAEFENDCTRKSENAENEPVFICAVDNAETHRLGCREEDFKDRIDLKIDHHIVGHDFATENYVDGSAAACAEIITDIILIMEKKGQASLTPASASALYAGIVSDTGCFKYSNVTAETLRKAALLIEHGAKSTYVCAMLFERKSRAELKAKQYMLNETEYLLDGHVAFLAISRAFRLESGVNDDEVGSLVSEMREVDGVDLAITLKEDMAEDGKFGISMRTSEKYNASELCGLFEGGGHARAAGGKLYAGSIGEAEKILLEKVISEITGAI